MKFIIVGLSLGAFVFLVWTGWRELQRVQVMRPTSWNSEQVGDCGVVLTGKSGRIREGFDLLARGYVRKLIVSGVHPRATLREIFPLWPYYSGLKEADVILERRSTTTWGNAQQTLPLVEALHCRTIVLLTSTLHLHRSYQTFRSVFPTEVVIYPLGVVTGSVQPDTSDLLVEVIKSVFYSLWAY